MYFFHHLFAAFKVRLEILLESHILKSFPKMISLYFCCVSTIYFSSSCLAFIQFQRGLFYSFASFNNFLL